ncbi:MAG TPA: hypothetical protein DEQ47_05455 [Solibacterales bacterium]|nr:hypothetical protein [Bryobacterales bacterium]
MRTILVFLLALPCLAADSFELLPHQIVLRGPEARHQLVAEATLNDHSEDWTRSAQWTSSAPQIASVDATGLITPMSDGAAVVTAAANGHTATAKVEVKGVKENFTWSFRNDVIPVMTKMGCNQGACHGALAGKNGFKLTLRGYDPDVDYDTLTRQSLGRRVSLSAPSHSLILLKPTMAIPHGGGKRFAVNSLEYRVISEWIAAGTPPPAETDPRVTALEVYPASATLKTGAEQQLVVRARYSDGNIRDVTRWVKFASSDEGVATVDDMGHVKMNGSGEAAITLYYASHVLYSRLAVPFANPVDPKVYTEFERHNYIDDFILAKLKALRIAPSKQCDDATFIRRAYIDAAGILPSSEEVETFLADRSPAKRSKLIDALLERDEYVDYWSYKWSDLLLVSSRKLQPNAMRTFYNWIHDSVQQNKPWDVFVREIFTGTGDTLQNGALNYFVLHKDPTDLTENMTLAFMGQRLTCARCHNHPLEKWTQKQYFQLANLFSRIGQKNGDQPGDVVIFAKASGDINHPRLLRPLPPAPLDAPALSLTSTVDRRLPFAAWLTSPNNAYFSRAIVNRIWGNFMGRGLVDPIDDVRATNPASNEELFAALSKDFVAHHFDMKYLVRTIMNSETYQLSSDANATNQSDNKYYSKYIVKRLPAEVLLDAFSQVTGVPTKFDGYALGTRALQLPDTRVKSQFLTSFGRPKRILCDAAERSTVPSIAQALHVINGDTLNKKLSAPDGFPALALKLGLSDSRLLDNVFLSAYSRYPSAEEKQPMLAALQGARVQTGSSELQKDARQKAIEDMLWAMLTGKEFLFNH